VLSNLYVRAIIEEDPKVTMLQPFLSGENLERLRQLEEFRAYETMVEAEAKAEAEAQVEAKVEAKVDAAVAKAKAQTAITTLAESLRAFLALRGDVPTAHAFKEISACADAGQLGSWLYRAYQGETAAQLFPEPE